MNGEINKAERTLELSFVNKPQRKEQHSRIMTTRAALKALTNNNPLLVSPSPDREACIQREQNECERLLPLAAILLFGGDDLMECS